MTTCEAGRRARHIHDGWHRDVGAWTPTTDPHPSSGGCARCAPRWSALALRSESSPRLGPHDGPSCADARTSRAADGRAGARHAGRMPDGQPRPTRDGSPRTAAPPKRRRTPGSLLPRGIVLRRLSPAPLRRPEDLRPSPAGLATGRHPKHRRGGVVALAADPSPCIGLPGPAEAVTPGRCAETPTSCAPTQPGVVAVPVTPEGADCADESVTGAQPKPRTPSTTVVVSARTSSDGPDTCPGDPGPPRRSSTHHGRGRSRPSCLRASPLELPKQLRSRAPGEGVAPRRDTPKWPLRVTRRPLDGARLPGRGPAPPALADSTPSSGVT